MTLEEALDAALEAVGKELQIPGAGQDLLRVSGCIKLGQQHLRKARGLPTDYGQGLTLLDGTPIPGVGGPRK